MENIYLAHFVARTMNKPHQSAFEQINVSLEQQFFEEEILRLEGMITNSETDTSITVELNLSYQDLYDWLEEASFNIANFWREILSNSSDP